MKPLAYSVLRELSDGELHSIEKLARSLKANSRCIISSLRDIQRFGIIIENTYEHYYRWHNPINWINENEIIKYLHKNKQLFQFVILNSVDSTNLYLLDRVKSSCVNLHKILVIIAEMQTRGRGRFGRQWFSGIGEGLTFSMLWRVNRSMSELSGLSLVVGVAIVRALKKFGINDFSLKWPNDVLFCFRKLAGILIELNNDICSGTFVVIGIGLNIKLSSLTKNNIDQAFIDLFSITGRSINRNKLLAVLLTELVAVLTTFNEIGFNHFRKEWISYHAFEGQMISIKFPDGSIQDGVADGVDYDGSIRLKLASGEIGIFRSGELSLC